MKYPFYVQNKKLGNTRRLWIGTASTPRLASVGVAAELREAVTAKVGESWR